MLMLLDDVEQLELQETEDLVLYRVYSDRQSQSNHLDLEVRMRDNSLREVPNYCMITEAVCRLTEATGDVAILPCDPEKIIKREGFS